MISLKIRDENGKRTNWWASFTRETREAAFGPGLKFHPEEWLELREQKLSEYNAEYSELSVIFQIEKDASMFLLVWS